MGKSQRKGRKPSPAALTTNPNLNPQRPVQSKHMSGSQAKKLMQGKKKGGK